MSNDTPPTTLIRPGRFPWERFRHNPETGASHREWLCADCAVWHHEGAEGLGETLRFRAGQQKQSACHTFASFASPFFRHAYVTTPRPPFRKG